jgi:hypothetical protein
MWQSAQLQNCTCARAPTDTAVSNLCIRCASVRHRDLCAHHVPFKLTLNAYPTEHTHTVCLLVALHVKQFNPLRAGFKRAEGDPNGCDTYARDCLNLGVKPDMLIQKARARFESAGGTVLENTSITGITVRPNGAEISVASDVSLTARLVLDCMGNGSPLVRQMRWGRKPEGICSTTCRHTTAACCSSHLVFYAYVYTI